MKKFLTLLIVLCFSANLVFAADDEEKSGDMTDFLNKSNVFDDPFAGQKQITDEEFQKTIDKIKEKQNKKKKGKNKQFKGKSIKQDDESGFLTEKAEKYLVLCVPVQLINKDGSIIPTGHYKIVGTKEQKKVYLDFYQSQLLVARVPAIETEYDFDEKSIDFVKILPYDEYRVKIIYGSIDFNAYTFVQINN